ncbi:Metallo-beta-lactamase superfamily protein [Halopseudomonas sabulinigri]|uniref:Metallo-beta-lactamase superfamily protein n=1 Tax=Halopseudomonas sabulinigri TaxID=472181 RepID=A0A1H1WUF4_9GAMM|nr:MBL fold metallo-hydrolase [Halopseudomonas sabulinigri]SDT00908.1 Metallo-beta-lactamase superfamily protein [Halopseudomonas sabulinigri]
MPRLIALTLFALLFGSAAQAAERPQHLRIALLITAQSAGSPEAFTVSGGRWRTERKLVHTALLVDHPQGRFLFDSGLGREIDSAFAANNWLNRTLLAYEQLDPALDQLERAGYQAEDIDFILPSHLHWDHLGGLPDFPHTPVKVLPSGLQEAREHGQRPAFLPEHLAGPREWQTLSLRDTPYAGFARSLDLFGDQRLVVVDLSGHTAGQVGLFVNLDSGRRLFFIGDTSWTLRGVEQNRSRPQFVQWIAHVDSDREANARVLQQIHQLHQQQPELLIVPAHDEQVARQLAHFPQFED